MKRQTGGPGRRRQPLLEWRQELEHKGSRVGSTKAWQRETGRLIPDGDIEGRKLGAMGPQWKRAETEGEVCWSVPDPWRGREG